MILVASRETLIGPASSYHGGWTSSAPATSPADVLPFILVVLVVATILVLLAWTVAAQLHDIADELRKQNRITLDDWHAEYLTGRIKKPKPVRRK